MSVYALPFAASSGGVDLTALIMAISGTLTAVAGIWMSRTGQSDTRRQQQAANALTSQKQEHDYYRDLVTDQRVEIDRMSASCDRERAAHEQTVAHLRDTITTLRSVVLDEVARASATSAADECDGVLDELVAIRDEHHH